MPLYLEALFVAVGAGPCVCPPLTLGGAFRSATQTQYRLNFSQNLS